MNIQIINDTHDRELYNTKATHPLQSWEWGEARKQMDIDVLRIGEFDPDLKNVFQITFHPIPYTNYKIGYLPRSTVPSPEVLDYLREYGQKHNIIFIKLEPYVQLSTSDLRLSTLTKSSHPLFPEWTFMLPLNKSEDELLAAMKPKTRYNIRLAQKKGVTVREESTEEGFETFSKLYFETTKRQKYHGHDKKYHHIVWNTLKNNMAHILIAYYEGTPLAAFELFKFNSVFYYPYGGTSDKHRNVMAANLIMWEAIRLGKRLGAETFDMWGSLPPAHDENNSWSGFTRFKEGYGGEHVQFVGSYDLIVNAPVYHLYSAAHRIRNMYLSVRA